MKPTFVLLTTLTDDGVDDNGIPKPKKRLSLFLNLAEIKIISIVGMEEGNILSFFDGVAVKNVLIVEGWEYVSKLIE